MPVFAICTLLGAGAGLWIPLVSGPDELALLCLLIVPLIWWLAGPAAGVFCVACFVAALHSHAYAGQLPDANGAPVDALVRGCVADFPVTDTEGHRFLLQLNTADYNDLPARLQLRTYSHTLRIPDHGCWQLRVRVRRAHGLSNPGSSDRAWHLYRNGVAATGYVRDSPLNKPLDQSGSMSLWLDMRRWLYARVEPQLPTAAAAGLVPGIVMGMRQSILPEQWQVLRATGTTHLMAISGLHIGMVAWLLWKVTHWIAVHFSGSGFQRAERLAAIAATFGALLYAGLAGFAAPTLRATGMLLLVLLLRACARRGAGNDILAAVFCLAVMTEPTAILASGFWLSYLAVFVLLNCCGAGTLPAGTDRRLPHLPVPLLQRWQQHVQRAVAVQWRLSLGLVLPGLLFFGQLALFAPLANLLAIPVFGMAVLPLLLGGAVLVTVLPSAGSVLLHTGTWVLDQLLNFLEWVASWPGALWEPPAADAAACLVGLAGIAMLARPLPPRQRCMGCGLLFVAWCLQQAYPGSVSTSLAIHVLDVGQGTAVVLQSGRQGVLLDAGPRWRSGDAGRQTVLPALRSMGIESLDFLVVSHGDNDHVGGVPAVLEHMPVGRLVAPESVTIPGAVITPCRRGQKWNWQGMQLHILHPASVTGWSKNDASCVVRLEWPGGAALFPGDIEARGEAVLAARESPQPIELIVAPHHGSRTSSTTAMLQRFPARHTVFTTGFGNRWGFPHPEVTGRWQQVAECVLNTATSGALVFRLQPDGTLRLQQELKRAWTRPWAIRAASSPSCQQHGSTL